MIHIPPDTQSDSPAPRRKDAGGPASRDTSSEDGSEDGSAPSGAGTPPHAHDTGRPRGPAPIVSAMAPHINQLRGHLLETLASLRDRANPMEPDRARAVAHVASVLVDTARVEVDYLKATGQTRAGFLEEPPDPATVHLGHTPSSSGYTQGDVRRWPGVTQHRLKG